jgi:radical SAM protein with 4Fe4S-binding SPASM domain
MIRTYLKLRNNLKDFYYFFQSKRLKKKEFPEIISIETSILCNAHCITCPHKEIKRQLNMDFSLFKKIIDEVSKYNVKEIHPFNYGEPFIYKYFIEALKYVKEKCPKTKIFVYSNGAAMNDAQMEEVVKNKLIDKANFSLDAASPETYRVVRGLDYNHTINNILKFIELNKKYHSGIEISVSFVINEKNEKELKQFKKIWKNKARIHIAVDDGREGKPFINKASKNPCSWLFNRTVILTNGDIVMCCVDAKGVHIIGNVSKKSIKEIWDSPGYEKIRDLHVKGDKNKIPICSGCYVRY